MKIQLYFLLITILFTGNLMAQNSAFETMMQKGIALTQGDAKAEQYQEAINLFTRIAAAEKENWFPNYYLSYSHVRMALVKMQEDNMEACGQHIEAAQKALDQAGELTESEAEILVLQSFIYQGRIWSDPQNNGPIYSPKAMAAAEQAIALAPDNPRPYHMIAQNLFFTPAFWGGGPAKAMPHLLKASERFESFVPESTIHPNWGKEFNGYMLSEAQKEERN